MKRARYLRWFAGVLAVTLLAAGCGCSAATPEDRRTAGELVAFAAGPSDAAFSPLRFAATVRLGVGGSTVRSTSGDALRRRAAWAVDLGRPYRGSTGEYNLLDMIRAMDGNLTVDCGFVTAGFPSPRVPGAFADHHRICMRTTTGTLLNSVAADLYVNARGRIAAVVLDHPEP